MILFPLLASLAQAGGPSVHTATTAKAGSKKNADFSKRSTPLTEYVAVSSFPSPKIGSPTTGTHYCLRNRYGKAGLEECSNLDDIMKDATSLFTFEPAPGYIKGQGYYTMKSAYDGYCVNFQRGANLLNFDMVDCNSTGTVVPWFFQWNTAGKDPGTGSFANPTYTTISAHFSKIVNVNDLPSNECYYPNRHGGIFTATCSDTQNMTWFGHATTDRPTNILVPTNTTTPCTLLYMNESALSHACQTMPGGVSIRGLSNSANGRLLASGSGLTAVTGLRLMNKVIVSFSILPVFNYNGAVAELYAAGNLTKPWLSLRQTDRKIEVLGLGKSIIDLAKVSQLPLFKTTKITVVVTMKNTRLFYDDKEIASGSGVHNTLYRNAFSFSSPPIDANGAIKTPVAIAYVGQFSIYDDTPSI